MWKTFLRVLTHDRAAQINFAALVVLTIWWLFLNPLDPNYTAEHTRFIWGAAYQIVALLGGLWGIRSARSWGGTRSVMGRAAYGFSIGLLLQAFGQSVYSFYNLFLQVEAPYPSVGDIGFFGSIPLYIYGVVLLARASGTKISLRAFKYQAQAVIIPLILLGASYTIFLRGYEFDWSAPLRVFLDFGYPLGQAMYVSLAILTYLLTRKILGGVMRIPVLFVLIALVIQYLADFNFLYQFSKEQWYVAGYGDYLYLLAYFIMSVSLIQLSATYRHIGDQG